MRGNSTISNRCRCHRTAAVDHRTSCRWRPPYAKKEPSDQNTIKFTHLLQLLSDVKILFCNVKLLMDCSLFLIICTSYVIELHCTRFLFGLFAKRFHCNINIIIYRIFAPLCPEFHRGAVGFLRRLVDNDSAWQ